ncbi:MAG: TetR/AcrR family transcriptional regulator [Microscillaceae bacterium]|nr:TetR/AcrR family transcriptional regulator [Microscillaceae bacterium]
MGAIATIKINVPVNIYKRDPEQTKLGRCIINDSILLIDDLGFEAFTFKKLAHQINSTEASVYRYFENKHNLLVYLVSWYWSWLEYQIDYQVNNIEDPEKKLRIAIRVLAQVDKTDQNFSHISENALHRIVISEAAKSYYTKGVDVENKEGFFRSYKSLCSKISTFMQEFNPKYPYSHALSSTVLEAAHQQVFFSQHLPSLTDFKVNDEIGYTSLIEFLEHIIFIPLRNYTP